MGTSLIPVCMQLIKWLVLLVLISGSLCDETLKFTTCCLDQATSSQEPRPLQSIGKELSQSDESEESAKSETIETRDEGWNLDHEPFGATEDQVLASLIRHSFAPTIVSNQSQSDIFVQP